MRLKKWLHSGLTIIIATQLVACQVVNNDPINSDYKKISNLIQEDQTASQFNRDMAEELEKLASKLENSANKTPQWEKASAEFHNDRAHFDRFSGQRYVFKRGLGARERFEKNVNQNVKELYQILKEKGLNIHCFIKSLQKTSTKRMKRKVLCESRSRWPKMKLWFSTLSAIYASPL